MPLSLSLTQILSYTFFLLLSLPHFILLSLYLSRSFPCSLVLSTLSFSLLHTHTHTHKHKHTHRHTQTHTDTHTVTNTQTHTDTHAHTDTRTHRHTHTQTHTHTQAHTHTHAYTHTHTHTHNLQLFTSSTHFLMLIISNSILLSSLFLTFYHPISSLSHSKCLFLSRTPSTFSLDKYQKTFFLQFYKFLK
jgi:hypothetical protein